MPREVPLYNLKQGINRLKVKGGAQPTSLYDLVNAYVTVEGSINPREGTIRTETLDDTTVGLSAQSGIFNVFSTTLVTVPSGYQDNVLLHPTDDTLTLTKIWFAKPIMGFQYVVAQYSNGDVLDFWLQSNGVWAPDTVYTNGEVIEPTSRNGFAYLPQRDIPQNPLWTADKAVALNDIIEPTEYTGFMYQAIKVLGTSPHTGTTEPVWPTVLGGQIDEFGDFDTTSAANDGSSTGGQPLGSAITDRYGDSAAIAGLGSVDNTTFVPPSGAVVTTWAPGTLYAPGAIVQPSTAQGAFTNAIPNGDFEAGNDGSWVFSGGGTVAYSSTTPYQGIECLQFDVNNNLASAAMAVAGAVTPGQAVTAQAYVNPNQVTNTLSPAVFHLILQWFTSGAVLISETAGPPVTGNAYKLATVSGNAPATAAGCRVRIQYATGHAAHRGFADLVSWNLETPSAVSQFLYEAIQAGAASSGTTEPVWPTVAGNTVVDNGVTWKAVGTSIITWQALAIMESGDTEPVWPTEIGGAVLDGNMSWLLTNRQIVDENHPNTIPTALGASHVFKGNKDIASYSAAVNPTDWTSANNAGYLPTGLNNYGDNDIAMLTLYRSNLMVFNAGGYQMWQIDPDPANMALLDAQPVGSIYPRAAQSVSNDLIFLTEVGVRNLGTVGATANMQVGSSGQPVDPIVKAQLKLGTYDPISLYYPGRGQYMLFFGPQAFVFTVNGQGLRTWSRYIFPDIITDWTLNEGKLYMRTAGNLVWQFDQDTLVDDFGGANVGFNGIIQWPYLDLGAIGINKMLVGLDIVGVGDVTIQVGFNQNDPTTFNDNAGFSASLNVTAPYTIASADTVPGEPLPIPINAPSYTVILTFGPNQAWSWSASTVYLMDAGGGGATG